MLPKLQVLYYLFNPKIEPVSMKKTKAISFLNGRLSETVFLGDILPERKPGKGLSGILMRLSSSFFPRATSGGIDPRNLKSSNDQLG